MIFDKVGGFIFGVLRGVFFIVLLYLGFLYLLGKEQRPNLLLEAKTYNYISKTANLVVKLFPIELNYKDETNDIIDKENLLNQWIMSYS